jgi:hypothetical protein
MRRGLERKITITQNQLGAQGNIKNAFPLCTLVPLVVKGLRFPLDLKATAAVVHKKPFPAHCLSR